MTKIKRYRHGYVFKRPYRTSDFIIIIFLVFLASLKCYLAKFSLPFYFMTLLIGVGGICYLFQPAYGYLNTTKKIAMSSSFERLPFSQLNIVPHEGSLLVVDTETNIVLFLVPNITEAKVNEIRAELGISKS